jgi:hypothetical protein
MVNINGYSIVTYSRSLQPNYNRYSAPIALFNSYNIEFYILKKQNCEILIHRVNNPSEQD